MNNNQQITKKGAVQIHGRQFHHDHVCKLAAVGESDDGRSGRRSDSDDTNKVRTINLSAAAQCTDDRKLISDDLLRSCCSELRTTHLDKYVSVIVVSVDGLEAHTE